MSQENLDAMRKVGYVQVGEFSTPDGARTVTTMWREVPAEARASGAR